MPRIELSSLEVRRFQAHVSLPPARGFRAAKAPDCGDEQAGDAIERASSDSTGEGPALGAHHRSALVESRDYLSVPSQPPLSAIMRDDEGRGDSPYRSAMKIAAPRDDWSVETRGGAARRRIRCTSYIRCIAG